MRTDATKVRQVLFNLLGNACKFTRNGTISLSARRVTDGASARIVFAVTDTGLGMTPDQLAAAFREFEQGGPGAPHAEGGTGLGLSISHRLCRLMDGDLLAESAPGQGTTFRAVLPVAVKGG
jgi:adenylate cyclase